MSERQAQTHARAQAAGVRASDFLRRYGILVAFALVVLVATIMFPRFWAWNNLKNIFAQSLLLCVVSSSMTMILLTGGVDMSLGTMASLCGALCAGFINRGIPSGIAVILAIVVGVACGSLNSGLVVYAKLPGFVATISTMFIFAGVELAFTKGFNIILSDSTINDVLQSQFLGIPFPVIALIVVIGSLHCFTRYTRTGLRMYAVGANRIYAAQSGVKLNKYTVAGYLIGGGLAGLSGVFLVARLAGHVPLAAGVSMLLDAFIAAFLGSTLFGRGEFNMLGSMVGGLFMGVLLNVFALIGIPVSFIDLAKGAVLIFAVGNTSIGKQLVGQVSL